MIEVKNLVKKYGDHVAVDNLTFTLEKGKIYGLLGPNGAGKSTTMNMMTGYIGATEGTVIINGHDILEEPREAKKNIGYLPEIPPLYTDMTVWEYLEFAAGLKDIPAGKKQESIQDAVRMTGLEDVQKRLIKNLSKGFRQRVGLAQAVLGMPEIIILDEPTVGLDPVQIIEIRSLIKALAKDHTVILSSHILSEISAVCDYIMIISHGRLVASDTTENLMHQMDNASELLVSVKTSIQDGMREIKELPGVQSVEPAKDQSEEAASFVISMSDDIREKLFWMCVDKNWPILEMKYSKATLEDVFLELTAEEKEYDEELQQLKETAERSVMEAENTKDSKEE